MRYMGSCSAAPPLSLGSFSVSHLHSGLQSVHVAALDSDAGRLEGMPVAAGGPQPSFSGPLASGGSGAGLPTKRSGAVNFGGQQVMAPTSPLLAMSRRHARLKPCVLWLDPHM